MSTLTIEGWCKISDDQKSTPVGDVHFNIEGPVHLRLEQAEERLQNGHESEVMVDVDMKSMDLIMPEGYGPLSDCQLRVYLSDDQRGQFHLVGHRTSDGSLIYTNVVLIAQLS
ncbi:hypothetical protein QN400_05960 [Pseudomonas sp. RTC3]|uniref:hypothetical protein n=1 Tax=unclassified Pseudomonas TaxID=196821 RepID=UPI002AB36B43|nr:MULTISPECIES: hypothetical protein [unclassified Pseudomonas]MEB0061563.1 hypothetical protein [Pseudomonas sp. RTC3]MDY7566662.1 hypothetical protein [Pseudomonas sp. 5C2]MEB0027392.1 hypothetical protein [Pseudomonas sp. MH9.2]MEB0148709.1 hypothetical protein [Pseudomonas sp. CCC2.2]MEB0240635.1 hypothetical protein [Pseudomonas sp. 5C2]